MRDIAVVAAVPSESSGTASDEVDMNQHKKDTDEVTASIPSLSHGCAGQWPAPA